MEKPILFICSQYHDKDCELLGINEGDFMLLLSNLSKLRDDIENMCIMASSPKIVYNILSNAKIHYRTEESFIYHNQETIYVPDKEYFCNLCSCSNQNTSIEQAWLFLLRAISEDIDVLEDRYEEMEKGRFLRSLLVYLTHFTITKCIALS